MRARSPGPLSNSQSVESFDVDMKEYRYRLILARLQADPNAPVPKKKGEGNDGNLVPKKKG